MLIPALLVYVIYMIIISRKKAAPSKGNITAEVASQTVILRQQKAEIERKNRDITDSINTQENPIVHTSLSRVLENKLKNRLFSFLRATL